VENRKWKIESKRQAGIGNKEQKIRNKEGNTITVKIQRHITFPGLTPFWGSGKSKVENRKLKTGGKIRNKE